MSQHPNVVPGNVRDIGNFPRRADWQFLPLSAAQPKVGSAKVVS
jgi:hypothetical protein